MKNLSFIKTVRPAPPRTRRGLLSRALGRFRIPFSRHRSDVDAAGDQHRAVRMFDVNFSNKWNR